MVDYKREVKLAIDIIKIASKITEWFRKRGIESFSFNKSDQSPVTLADFASQIYLINKLVEHFPDDKIIAEEENIEFIDSKAENLIKQCFHELNLNEFEILKENVKYRGKISKRQWTIDPIDGTIGYQKGLLYAIGLGLMVDSNPKISVIAIPNYNQKPLAIFIAEEGKGAKVSYKNGDFKPIVVSKKDDLQNVRLCHSLHYDQPWVINFAKSIGISNLIQIDSMAKFCMVAEGTADVYIKPLDVAHSFTWDFMPGDLIIREAGGDITDLNGVRLKFKEEKCLWTAPGIIASNGILQNTILDLYKKFSKIN
ncbi:MAG: inositol monophosphatase family protein [Candidatus Thorarchaeota archaeon]